MKNTVLFAASLFVLVACNNKEKSQEEISKARQETLDSVNQANNRQRTLDSLTAVSNSVPDAVVIETPTLQPETPKAEPRTRANTPKKSNEPKSTTPASTPPVATSPATTNNTPSSSGTVASAPSGGGTAETGTMTAEEKKKKGLNNAAKGAIIGLGTGAAAGAILNKENRGKGAVIGGVVGAVGGAVGGAVLDKRKAKKEAEKDSTNKK